VEALERHHPSGEVVPAAAGDPSRDGDPGPDMQSASSMSTRRQERRCSIGAIPVKR
jgi:hypothetical protein